VQLIFSSKRSEKIHEIGSRKEYYNIFKLCLTLYTLQSICSYDETSNEWSKIRFDDEKMQIELENCRKFQNFVQNLRQKIGLGNWDENFFAYFKQSLKHFLRLCAVFFHFLFDVRPPEALL
uniref:Uncharacterized protein n=1 Tax=Romanomermis culicivorax TaxID=13658 RepID=A0A915KE50_ROMCU